MFIKPDWSRLLHRLLVILPYTGLLVILPYTGLLVILPYTGLPTNNETVKTKVETNIKEYFSIY